MCLLLLIMVIVLFVMMNKETRRRVELEERLDRLMRNSDGDSIEQMVSQVFKENDELQQMQAANYQDIKNLEERLRTVIQKVGIVKYDAFQQMGGNLSSAIAMLDQDDNGFIINTVQSVDGCYSYVKAIRHGHPDVAFGKEEEEAVEIAKNGGTPGDTVYIGDTNSPQGKKPEKTARRPVRRTSQQTAARTTHTAQPGTRPAHASATTSRSAAAKPQTVQRRPVKKAPPSQPVEEDEFYDDDQDGYQDL